MLIAERWLLGRLRHTKFHSLTELNAAVAEFTRRLNDDRVIRRVRQRAACMYTIVETCKMNGINPQAYLTDIIVGSPTIPSRRLTTCCPGVGNHSPDLHLKPLRPRPSADFG